MSMLTLKCSLTWQNKKKIKIEGGKKLQGSAFDGSKRNKEVMEVFFCEPAWET